MMDSKEAIRCLQQDIHYYEDPFVDVDKEIVKLIQQQDKMLELAINAVARLGCPLYEHEPCPEMSTEVSCADCWRKYLQSEVSK